MQCGIAVVMRFVAGFETQKRNRNQQKPITMRVIVEIIHSKLLDIYRRQVRRKSSLSAGVATLNKRSSTYIYDPRA